MKNSVCKLDSRKQNTNENISEFGYKIIEITLLTQRQIIDSENINFTNRITKKRKKSEAEKIISRNNGFLKPHMQIE